MTSVYEVSENIPLFTVQLSQSHRSKPDILAVCFKVLEETLGWMSVTKNSFQDIILGDHNIASIIVLLELTADVG